jgi:titin
MTLAFVAPANNGGSPITGYNATCESDDGGAPGSASGPASPLVVSELTNGADYTCTVTATSGLGTSVPSDESGPTLVATVPDAPAITRVSVASGSVRVAFNGSADDGGTAVLSYSAYCVSRDVGGVARRRTGLTSPITVPGLTNGKHYTCSVTARNGIGASGASDASRVVIVGAPNAPSSVVAVSLPTSGTTGSLRVSYVARSNNGSEITKFTARCVSLDGGVARGAVLTGPDAAAITVKAVTTGRTYGCWVTATNARGEGVASTGSEFVVAGAPAAPSAVKAVRTAAGQLTVTFKAGANNGAAVTGYTVVCESDDGGDDVAVGTATTSVTITGLTVGKTYSCSVVAGNARGSSVPSDWSPPVVV